MDTAVALVNAYLHINGYFTVTEYQVIESHYNGARARTDLDILAVLHARTLGCYSGFRVQRPGIRAFGCSGEGHARV